MPTMTSNGQPVSATGSQNYDENGRTYHGYRRGMYLYPCDEEEKDRMDIYHKIFEVARRGILHTTPVVYNADESTRILDVGCGTGIWAIDMADKYNFAEVIGLDLVNIQPLSIPPNLRFRVPCDYESLWTFGENSFDLIHIQMAAGGVTSWPELYHKVYSHLKPGNGYIEQVEVDLEPRCDDGTLPPDSHIKDWYNYLKDATERAQRPIAYQHSTKEMLHRTGFIDITETVIRAPLNGWALDTHQKQIGRWYSLGLSEGLQALSLAPFTRIYKWQTNEFDELLKRVKKEIVNNKIHAYHNIHIITARKPL